MTALDKRLARWLEEWAKARARWAIFVRKDDYFNTGVASELHLNALERMTYCEDKFMSVLYDARDKGTITQAQVEEHIWTDYPRMVAQSDALIKGYYDDKH
jgi:hypothetical protein